MRRLLRKIIIWALAGEQAKHDAAGTIECVSSSAAATLADPATGWDWAFFGDQ